MVKGSWLVVTHDGGMFAFDDAPLGGSMGRRGDPLLRHTVRRPGHLYFSRQGIRWNEG